MDDVRKRLRDAAAEHRPDRERMLARVERGMERDAADLGAPHRGRLPRPAPWLRIAGATAAVAGVFALGGYAVASVVQGEEPPPSTVGTPPAPDSTSAPSPSASVPDDAHAKSSPPAEPTRPSGKETKGAPDTGKDEDRPSEKADPSPPTQRVAPDARSVEDGYLWSDGSIDPQSNDFWAQSTLTFKTGKPLTALTVELRVAQTGGVADAGNWRSLPADDFTISVRQQGGELVYRWTLKAGRTVPAGEHVFAGQYNHAEGGRDAGEDTYAAEATASGRKAAVRGDFARTS
ncbi:hypothetical protein GCM10009837_47530 [Streptomyces durmitorensis]|uniref:Uncharacterized protein n=1 Tax=Streptomyces durmitorensis TaxID=319947 RepID=A0ABY4Q538_9ACTN|nr:hypothetical protein [Streptomyces durmitorensis]UQT60276.1 hypothetical protein M4V62_37340 [Streptomyces durmitorensis]